MTHPFLETISVYSIVTSRIRCWRQYLSMMFAYLNLLMSIILPCTAILISHCGDICILRAFFDIHLICAEGFFREQSISCPDSPFWFCLVLSKVHILLCVRKMCRLTEFLLAPQHGYNKKRSPFLCAAQVSLK